MPSPTGWARAATAAARADRHQRRSVWQQPPHRRQQVRQVERLGENHLGTRFARRRQVRVRADGIRFVCQRPETAAAGDGDHANARIAFAQGRDQLDAMHLGHDDIRNHDVRRLPGRRVQRRGGVVRDGHRIAGTLENAPDLFADFDLIIDNQDVGHLLFLQASAPAAVAGAAAAAAAGKYTLNVVPLPTADRTVMTPPRELKVPWTTESPRPVPSPTSRVVKNGSKMWASTV